MIHSNQKLSDVFFQICDYWERVDKIDISSTRLFESVFRSEKEKCKSFSPFSEKEHNQNTISKNKIIKKINRRFININRRIVSRRLPATFCSSSRNQEGRVKKRCFFSRMIYRKNRSTYYDFHNKKLYSVNKYIYSYSDNKKVCRKCYIYKYMLRFIISMGNKSASDFYDIYKRFYYSKLYFSFINPLLCPTNKPIGWELDVKSSNRLYVYSTNILMKYQHKYLFNSYIWKKMPHRYCEMKSMLKSSIQSKYKNIIIRKVIVRNPRIYFYILHEKNRANRGPPWLPKREQEVRGDVIF